ncbi:hypothetical protein cce_5082 [Crocosphaera subtropica ATCC 51142]|uniref:Uncharacterized protein n=1 Tax=Crocosphaera subtropica (strain ATCC 51142 / BH68) TaxID=43989 RepID=B1X2R7_CROS5|nr:hypothetical protein [Crocosphaera subtropica]ACB54428.1 hypothetical protein cce_5082 [Crocosphaera subtropica ATCC 51142]
MLHQRLALWTCMHVISYRKLKNFIIKHGDVKESLDSWFKAVTSHAVTSKASFLVIHPLSEVNNLYFLVESKD